MDEYHRFPALTRSQLKDAMKSMRNFQELHVTRTRKKDPIDKSKAPLRIGSAFHSLLLEGEEAYKKLVVPQEFKDFRTKDAQNWRDSVLEQKLVYLSAEEEKVVRAMVTGAMRNARLRELFENVDQLWRPELTWRMWYTPQICVQARTDWFSRNGIFKGEHVGPLVLDIKSIDALYEFDADKHMANAYFDFGYFIQVPYYCEVVGSVLKELEKVVDAVPYPKFLMAYCEKEPPYDAVVVEPDQETVNLGRLWILLLIKKIVHCHQTGVWPGIADDDVMPLKLMPYHRRPIEQQLGIGYERRRLE